MNTGPSDERLSAYLDREATPAEREAVENLLEASPDARSELEAFSELSQLLKALPPQAAPGNFSQRVMQRVAAAAPVATPSNAPTEVPPTFSASVAPAVPPVVASPRKSYRREWLSAFAGAVVSAATLLLAVGPRTESVTYDAVAPLGVADQPTGALELAPMVMVERVSDHLERDNLITEKRDARLADEIRDKSLALRKSAPRASAKNGEAAKFHKFQPELMAKSMASELAPGAPVPPEQALARASDVDAKSSSPQIPLSDFLANWTTLDVNGQYVANVDLEVVDVERSADMLQVLLVQNGIAKVANEWSEAQAEVANATGDAENARGASAPRPKAFDKAKQNLTTDDSGLIAVYVESDQVALLKSLEELSRNDMVLRTRLNPPLPYFDLPAMPNDEASPSDSPTKRNESRQLAEQATLQRKVTNVARAYNFQQFGVDPLFAEQELREAEDAPVSALEAWDDADWYARASIPADRLELRKGRLELPLLTAQTAPMPEAKPAPSAVVGRPVAVGLSAATMNDVPQNAFNTKLVLGNHSFFSNLNSSNSTRGFAAQPDGGQLNRTSGDRFSALNPAPFGGTARGLTSFSAEEQRFRMMHRNGTTYGNTAINTDAARQQAGNNTIRVLFVMVPGPKQAAPEEAGAKAPAGREAGGIPAGAKAVPAAKP